MPLTPRMRRAALPLLAFALGLIALGLAAVTVLDLRRPVATASAVGGPFALVDQDGRSVTQRDFQGRPHLVFFGFTHCPDVCPTTLQQISDVLAALGPKGRDVKALFVTVDPERDTPAALKQYLASFDPRIVGLTGSPEAVAATIKAYRAYSRKVPLKDGDYTMEHTALVYIMDKDDGFVGSLNLMRPPAESAAEIARQL
ncbi:SCO family protein [Methylobacterium oryzihabitans]|uniref:SCO family protein n=1 Tax=Methylobacterium oryzihabitans TaxID=2499852 RepID=A0A437P5Z4_9HYPH|nr:SCO family protein [Methylobacterium oryzihabitans]RVU17700.1 SCO family protein [Methylobacterium oryzihabitans]